VIKTFIRGFDEQLGGGIPEGSVVLLAGPPGSMKSTIGFSILYHNQDAQRSDPTGGKVKGLYVTLEQGRRSLLHHFSGIGMADDTVLEGVRIMDVSESRKNLKKTHGPMWFQEFKESIEGKVRNKGYNLLVLDSLDVLDVVAHFDDRRTNLFQFFEWLRDLEITALLISEKIPDFERMVEGYEEGFLADGIIMLGMERSSQLEVHRLIRCVKMRSANHKTNYFSLMFEDGSPMIAKSFT